MTPGIYPAIGAAEYHADPWPVSLSASIAATLLRRSPLHAHHEHPRLGNAPRESSADMDRGTVIHELVFGGGGGLTVCDYPDWRTKAAREERDAARAAGSTPVLAHQADALGAAAEAIRAALAAAGLSLSGASEATALWESAGVRCRGRPDHLILRDDGAIIIELKTMSESAHSRSCARRVVSFGEDIQLGAYIEAIETLHPELRGRVEFIWAFAEQDPPYATTVTRPSGTMIELGQRRWHRARDIWARCLAEGRWPGYDNAGRLEPPAWALSEEMEQLT